jgi:hypothetical protein
MAETEGFSARVPSTPKTAVKSAYPDNRGGLRVPSVCTGTISELERILRNGKAFHHRDRPRETVLVAASALRETCLGISAATIDSATLN